MEGFNSWGVGQPTRRYGYLVMGEEGGAWHTGDGTLPLPGVCMYELQTTITTTEPAPPPDPGSKHVYLT